MNHFYCKFDKSPKYDNCHNYHILDYDNCHNLRKIDIVYLLPNYIL